MPSFLSRVRWMSWAFAAVAVALAVLALRDAAVAVYSRSNPALALSISPADPRALPAVIDRSAFSGQAGPSGPAQEARLRDGLRAMPLSPRTLRLLATSEQAQANPEQAAKAMAIAGQMSRRDMLTEVVLADAAARAGDAPTAMRRINAALSTSRGAGELAFPFLVQMLADPTFRPIVTRYVDQPWGDEFLYYAAQHGRATDALAVALGNPAAQTQGRFARFRSELLAHLVSQGDARLAFDYVRRLKGPEAAILTEPGFSRSTTDAAFAPLSWALTNRDGIYADRVGDAALLTADPGARGVALERVLQLEPGTWQLVAKQAPVQAVADSRAEWTFACASGANAPSLGSAEMPLSKEPGSVHAQFNVPSACQAVRVSLELRNLDDQRALEIELDELALQRVGG